MAKTDILDLVIIGSGPGGLTAGIYAARATLNMVIAEKGVPGGQVTMSDEVENWPGIERISGSELALNMSQHAQAYDINTISREVTEVIPGQACHRIRFDNDEVLETHAVILGTGGSPRKLGIPGEEENYGKGVSYCAVCDGFFFRGKTVVVVGGGDSACEEALYLAKLAGKVYIAHRRDELRAGRLLQKRVMETDNIEILWNSVLTSINVKGADGVGSVDLQDTVTGEKRSLDTDGVFVFIGFVPNNAVVPADVELTDEGYVITDEKCET
ncbi:MAG: FAD-dependent oxidoreductase, partial [Desulfobacterales bacterium]|nr:FAD-dependent oxidoreductase [Desulfobacterales bacterium]